MSLERKQIDGVRETVVAIQLKEVKKDKEYEISPYIILTTMKDCFINTAQQPAFVDWDYTPPDIPGYDEPGYTLEAGTTLRIDLRAYVSNSLLDDTDIDLDAGTTGHALNPAKNTRNDVTWTADSENLASLQFDADSDPDPVYLRLSTTWPKNAYDKQLDNADAYYYDFTSTTGLPSRGRATLEIVNPFYDHEEDTLSIPLEDIAIYQDMDGVLIDVSPLFTATENNGVPVLATHTRTLGIYVVADRATLPASAIKGIEQR